MKAPRAAATAAAAAGTWLLAAAYTSAAAGVRTHLTSWAALLLMFAPSTWLLIRREDGGRMYGLGLLSALSAAPRLLRSGGTTVYSDEWAHLREVADIVNGWDMGLSNSMVRMASEFRGLHHAAAGIAAATGTSGWTAGMLAVSAAHTIAVPAVYMLVRRHASARAAGLAAFIYATNPSYLIFHMQMAYESYALPLALVTLLLLQQAAVDGRTRIRIAAGTAAAVTAAGVAVSHHLTFLFLTLTVAGAAAVRMARRYGPAGVMAFGAAAGIAAAVAVAAAGQTGGAGLAGSLWAYLSPALEIISSRPRAPFGGSQLPWYEIAAGMTLPAVVLTAAVWSAVSMRGLWPAGPAGHIAVGVSLLTLTLPVSFPLALVEASAEGARRSWAWGYLGASMLIGLAYGTALRFRPEAQEQREGRLKRSVHSAALIAPLLVMAVGGVAVGMNENYRMPGPWATGADGRTYNDEVRLVAEHVAAAAGPGDRVLADRYMTGPIAVSAPVEAIAPSDANPLWNVMFLEEPSEEDLARLAGQVRFIVVDRRMADRAAGQGFWYNRGEPAGSRLHPDAGIRLSRIADRTAEIGNYTVWTVR